MNSSILRINFEKLYSYIQNNREYIIKDISEIAEKSPSPYDKENQINFLTESNSEFKILNNGLFMTNIGKVDRNEIMIITISPFTFSTHEKMFNYIKHISRNIKLKNINNTTTKNYP